MWFRAHNDLLQSDFFALRYLWREDEFEWLVLIRFRWNARLSQPRGAKKGAVRKTSRHMGVRCHLVYPPRRLSAVLGRGSTSALCADQGRIVRRTYRTIYKLFQNIETLFKNFMRDILKKRKKSLLKKATCKINW